MPGSAILNPYLRAIVSPDTSMSTSCPQDSTMSSTHKNTSRQHLLAQSSKQSFDSASTYSYVPSSQSQSEKPKQAQPESKSSPPPVPSGFLKKALHNLKHSQLDTNKFSPSLGIGRI